MCSKLALTTAEYNIKAIGEGDDSYIKQNKKSKKVWRDCFVCNFFFCNHEYLFDLLIHIPKTKKYCGSGCLIPALGRQKPWGPDAL